MAKLRIIIDKARSARFNMAADLYIYEKCKLESDTIYLRIYRWEAPTLSLGYMQKTNTLCGQDILARDGIEVIRRATGGRTVLHWDDITYSFIFSKKLDFLGKTINETYEIISDALSDALGLLGVNSEKSLVGENSSSLKDVIKMPCFLSPNRNEILINGRKLIGSAQKRGKKAILQHGSIALNKKFRNVVDYLNITSENKSIILKELSKKAVSLNEIISLPDVKVIEDKIIEGFKKNIEVDYFKKDWTPEEVFEIENKANSSEFIKKWLYF